MKTSLTGYKKNSKDKSEPLLEIPSNSITMEGVSFPIVSVLDDGSFKVMKPNENYLFNTKSVIEIPVRQRGGYAFDYMKGEYQKNEPLPEVTIKDNAPKSLSDFWKRYKNQIFEDNKHSLAGSLFAAPVQTVVDLPQALSTYYLDRQKNTEPSKALGIKNPVAAFATDTVLDPVSLIGGILAKGTKITKSTKLKKAVKANSIGSTDDMLFRIFEDSKLKDYKQEDVLSLFEEFKTRIQTPEGKKRLKELGVSEQDIEHLVNHTKVKADPKSVGYHWNNTVGMHPSLSGDVGKNILRHELEHAVQGFSPSGKTSIDKLLENLELRSSPSKKGVSKSFSDKELRDVEVKNIVENDLSDAQDAVDYFSSGSNGREKSAFLAEMQQYMLNKKIIKHPYDKITVDHVREAIAESAFDTDYPLRIAKIIKPNNKNYEILSEGLNKLATTAPIVALNNTDMKNKKQKGGLINKFESYLSSLKEDEQDQVIDYIESLGSDEQEMFLKGGMTMWKKYQQGGLTMADNPYNMTVTQSDYRLKGRSSQNTTSPRGIEESNKRVLSKGSTGEEVAQLQKFLKGKGFYKGEVDSVYGSQTEKAVKEYQKWFNKTDTSDNPISYIQDGEVRRIGKGYKKIDVDGIVGDETRSALMYRHIPKPTPKQKREPVSSPAPSINRDYTTTDNIGNAGPVVMDYLGGLGLAGMAALPWSLELLPTIGETGISKTLQEVGLKGEKLFEKVKTYPQGKTSPGNPGTRHFQPKTPSSYGTRIQYEKGGQNNMSLIEVEDKETILNPNGELYGFNGNTHANGGIDILAEGGSKIFSEYSKAPKELIKTVLGKETKKKMSYADLSKKFDTTKWSKILKNPDSDQYEKETAKLKMSGNLAMLETIFQTQEEEKMKSGKNSEYQYGGPVLPQKKMYTSFWDTRQDIEMGKDVEGLTIEQQLTPLQQIKAMYNQLPEVTITGKRPTYPGNSQYDLVVTETEPSTMASSPNRKTSPVYFGNGVLPPATKTLDVVDPNDTSVARKPTFKLTTNKSNSSAKKPLFQLQDEEPPEVTLNNNAPVINDRSSLVEYTSQETQKDTPVDSSLLSTENTNTNTKTSKNPFGISHKLAGTILDIGLALGDTLTVQNPQYRDLRKSPLFSRFVDFDDKEAGRNLALNIQQIQNSNMPEEVKQARIANLNAQYQDHTAKVAFGNAQRYETKINQDTEKLQTYINNNIDQHFQDVERYNQQKARVDYLKDQFHAQQKSRVVGSIRNYLDYAEETRIKNQLNSENYRVNPLSGNIQFLGNKQDALKKKEMEMQQYAQNAVPVKNLPNGAVLARTPQGVEIIIDSTGKATVVKG